MEKIAALIPNGTKEKIQENIKFSKYIWKQVYKSKEDGKLIVDNTPMLNMTDKHIINAIHKCQREMVELHKLMNGWEDILSKLEEVAEIKDIKLEDIENDPDAYIKIRRNHKPYKVVSQ